MALAHGVQPLRQVLVKKHILWWSATHDFAGIASRLTSLGYTVETARESGPGSSFGSTDVIVVDSAEDLRASPTWSRVLGACPEKPVVFFSHCARERADLRRAGAYYVGRPGRTADELTLVVARAAALRSRSPNRVDPTRELLVGESPAMGHLRRALWHLAKSPRTSVLLQGEPGVGKRTFARALHLATAREQTFEDLSQVHDLERAVSKSQAATAYLGDLSRLSSAAQRRLASVLNQAQRSGQTRFVAALTILPGADASVWSLLAELSKRFLLTLDVPPLRERSGDVPLLVDCLLARLVRGHEASGFRLSADAQRALEAHLYPDNVRELEGLLRRALLLAQDGYIDVCHLPTTIHRPSAGYRLPSTGVSLELLEREVLTQALRIAGGNRTRAASLLGLTRDQVRYRLTKLRVDDARADSRVA